MSLSTPARSKVGHSLRESPHAATGCFWSDVSTPREGGHHCGRVPVVQMTPGAASSFDFSHGYGARIGPKGTPPRWLPQGCGEAPVAEPETTYSGPAGRRQKRLGFDEEAPSSAWPVFHEPTRPVAELMRHFESEPLKRGAGMQLPAPMPTQPPTRRVPEATFANRGRQEEDCCWMRLGKKDRMCGDASRLLDDCLDPERTPPASARSRKDDGGRKDNGGIWEGLLFQPSSYKPPCHTASKGKLF
jgi:hypothetical protein